eukprot:TRINITY_DN9924_c0_g3_i1.p1 TRINITY_DN9924_c0_g3~~TRINITY_DN9924_c0_g3_i1.p1  ORF type:complete len:157 (-),score=2.97 TRINITY_DN9924_c0_g3_i1:106-576(-)
MLLMVFSKAKEGFFVHGLHRRRFDLCHFDDMRDDSFCLGAKILKFSRPTPKANARAILKVMPTERTRARLRKLLAPCCLDCNGSNDVTPAGFDHLKPRDVVTLSTCSHAACSLARSSRLPWKQLDVFLHNPHRHISLLLERNASRKPGQMFDSCFA